jgi:MFS family permease
MVMGSILMGVGLLIMPFVPVDAFYPWEAVPLVMMAVANGCMMPSITTLLSSVARENEQGQVLGINQSFQSLSRIAGPMIGGTLYGLHYTAPYIGGAVLMAGALLFILAFQRMGAGQAAA